MSRKNRQLRRQTQFQRQDQTQRPEENPSFRPNENRTVPPHATVASSATASLSPDPETLPPWLPAGDSWNDLPAAVRQAVPKILVPAYRQFVLQAPDELQRSVGLSLVHLLWLELCDQQNLVEVVANPHGLAATLHRPEEMIDRHLSLIAAKSQTSELLVKIRLVNDALARSTLPLIPLTPDVAPMTELEKQPPVEQLPLPVAGDRPNFHLNENETVPRDALTPDAAPMSELEKQPLMEQLPCHATDVCPNFLSSDNETIPSSPTAEAHAHV
jgi:hypothetical protein